MNEVEASGVDEQRIARIVSLGLPAVTIVGAMVVGFTYGAATSILVVAAGLLLGVISLLWASIRILSGDAPLPPEIEALDMAEGGDALLGRKKMLLRALKDLENERAIGKIETEDFEQVSQTYRAELKTVLRLIDETLAPTRSLAEDAVRAHLAAVGLSDGAAKKARANANAKAKRADDTPSPESDTEAETEAETAASEADARVACPKCDASNEPDAKFCKECATALKAASTAAVAAAPVKEETSDAQ